MSMLASCARWTHPYNIRIWIEHSLPSLDFEEGMPFSKAVVSYEGFDGLKRVETYQGDSFQNFYYSVRTEARGTFYRYALKAERQREGDSPHIDFYEDGGDMQLVIEGEGWREWYYVNRYGAFTEIGYRNSDGSLWDTTIYEWIA